MLLGEQCKKATNRRKNEEEKRRTAENRLSTLFPLDDARSELLSPSLSSLRRLCPLESSRTLSSARSPPAFQPPSRSCLLSEGRRPSFSLRRTETNGARRALLSSVYYLPQPVPSSPLPLLSRSESTKQPRLLTPTTPVESLCRTGRALRESRKPSSKPSVQLPSLLTPVSLPPLPFQLRLDQFVLPSFR
jgi:hypothetical protein